MSENIKSNHTLLEKIQNQKISVLILVLVGVFHSFMLVFALRPTAVDWFHTFYPTAQVPLDPYSVPTYLNMPWLAVVLYPFSFFSEMTSMYLNAILATVVFILLVVQKKGTYLSVLLTITSAPYFGLILTGTIDWIPALGFFFQNALGVILLFSKPQNGILAALDWLLKSEHKLRLVLIPAAFAGLSFLIWPGWLFELMENVPLSNVLINPNASLFPWTVPLGVYLIFHIIKNKPEHGEFFGVLATFCLMPYFAPHSLVILFALFAAAYPRRAVYAWVVLWGISIWEIIARVNGG